MDVNKKENRENDFRAWNEKMAIKYNPDDYHNRSSYIVRIVENIRKKVVISLLNILPKDKVLEVGCGAGNLIENVEKGWILGIDLSWYLIKIAKKRVSMLSWQ